MSQIIIINIILVNLILVINMFKKKKYTYEIGEEIFIDKAMYEKLAKPIMSKKEKEIYKDQYRQVFNIECECEN